MLGRGTLEGLQGQQFRSGFASCWNYICHVRHLQELYHEAMKDILLYKAAGGKSQLRVLLKSRLEMLGQQTGSRLDLDELTKEQASTRMSKYEAFLSEHYNLSKQVAAEVLEKAMAAEANAGQVPRGRRRRLLR